MKIVKGDITKLPFFVNVIVNSAHPTLMPGGGVCGAIHAYAGEGLKKECEAIMAGYPSKYILVASPVATTPHKLKDSCDWIIHVNVPVYEKDYEWAQKLLAESYRECLLMAERLNAKSIAFPLLGAGIYAWPQDLAKEIAEKACEDSRLDVSLVLYKELKEIK